MCRQLYSVKHKVQLKRYRTKYRENPSNREAHRNQRREWEWRKYGLNFTIQEYDQIFKLQNGLCAICGTPERTFKNGKIQPLSLDHNHTTKQVRGLICNKCNIMLGMANDSINILKEAIKYLENQNG